MKNQKTVGVVVGRFQTPYIHEGHHDLILTAKKNKRKLLIAVGVSGGAPSKNDPLDFPTRAAMLKEAYPEATIIKVNDQHCNHLWSKQLDLAIEKHFPEHEAILFGSRDCFFPHYHGVNKKRAVKVKIQRCATELRNKVATEVRATEDFRIGAMYASTVQSFPTSYQAVDIIVTNPERKTVLIGRKPGETGWRFPGGFVDPTDSSLEHAVRREASEEVGDIELDDIKYLCSLRINDHRYRTSEHKIMSALFTATFVFGRIKAGDDLEEVRWEYPKRLEEFLVDAHKPLGRAYLNSITKK